MCLVLTVPVTILYKPEQGKKPFSSSDAELIKTYGMSWPTQPPGATGSARTNFGYVIRLRGNIHVTDAESTTADAADWVGTGGRARTLRGAMVTGTKDNS